MPIIKVETIINAPVERVFDLSRSIDLHKISTKQTNEEAIDGITSGLIGLNQSVTWRARHFGVYQKLTSKITVFERPNYFTDEMISGAFQSFKHDHIFNVLENGTLMKDVFDYVSPFGFIGKLADRLFLENYMKRLLETRNETIKKFAETDLWTKVL